MEVEVFDDLCIACGQCIAICPEIFEWGDDDKAVAKSKEVPGDQQSLAHEAVEACPTAAIKEDE